MCLFFSWQNWIHLTHRIKKTYQEFTRIIFDLIFFDCRTFIRRQEKNTRNYLPVNQYQINAKTGNKFQHNPIMITLYNQYSLCDCHSTIMMRFGNSIYLFDSISLCALILGIEHIQFVSLSRIYCVIIITNNGIIVKKIISIILQFDVYMWIDFSSIFGKHWLHNVCLHSSSIFRELFIHIVHISVWSIALSLNQLYVIIKWERIVM